MQINESFNSNILRKIVGTVESTYNEKYMAKDEAISEVSLLLRKLFWEELSKDDFKEEIKKLLVSIMDKYPETPSYTGVSDYSYMYKHKDGRWVKSVEKIIQDHSVRDAHFATEEDLKNSETDKYGIFNGEGNKGGYSTNIYNYNQIIEKVEKFFTVSDKEEVTYFNNNNKNFAEFMVNCLKSINSEWGKVDLIKDSDFTKIDKIPKVITEKNKLFYNVLFWIDSSNAKNNDIDKTDKLYAITKGNEILWSKYYGYINKSKAKNSYAVIKDLSEVIPAENIKLFALSEPYPDIKKQAKKEIEDRRDMRGTYLSSNKYERDEQYKAQLTKQINKYKTIIERRKQEYGADVVSKELDMLLIKVGDFIKENRNTSTLRNINGWLSEALSKYDDIVRYGGYLKTSYSDYYKKEQRNSIIEFYKRKEKIINIIEKGSN